MSKNDNDVKPEIDLMSLNFKIISDVTRQKNAQEAPDFATGNAKADLESEREQYEIRMLANSLTENRALKYWRNITATIVILSVQLWMGTIFYIIFWQGHLKPEVRLSNEILTVLIGTVGVDIIGLLVLLVRYVLDPKYYLNNKDSK